MMTSFRRQQFTQNRIVLSFLATITMGLANSDYNGSTTTASSCMPLCSQRTALLLCMPQKGCWQLKHLPSTISIVWCEGLTILRLPLHTFVSLDSITIIFYLWYFIFYSGEVHHRCRVLQQRKFALEVSSMKVLRPGSRSMVGFNQPK